MEISNYIGKRFINNWVRKEKQYKNIKTKNMNNFDLNAAPESTNNNGNVDKKIYQKPGICDNTVVTGVVLGASSLNKVPYLELQTVGPNGELGKSNRMWLSTDIGKNIDGSLKKTSGWGVTARNIIMILEATHNITRDEAKAIQLVPENPVDENGKAKYAKEQIHNMLATKLSTLLVGRPFRAKFKGEQSKPRPDGTPGLIFSTMDLVESMNVPKEQSFLRFDAARDIKLYENAPVNAGVANDDLPF